MRYPELEEGDFFARSWHMDEYTPYHIRIFLLLSDTSEGKGSSCSIDRNDSKKLLADIKGNFKRDSEFWNNYNQNHFSGDSGAVALAYPVNHFHRGTNPEGYRDIAIVTVRPL